MLLGICRYLSYNAQSVKKHIKIIVNLYLILINSKLIYITNIRNETESFIIRQEIIILAKAMRIFWR